METGSKFGLQLVCGHAQMMIVHLTTHSYFSLLEGLASPQQLVEAAARFGMPAIGLTDHNRLSGAIEFHDACRKAGIQPLLGMDVDFLPGIEGLSNPSNPTGRLVLLAQNRQGWSNLCRLASLLQSDPTRVNPLDQSQLEKNNAGF